MKVTGKLVVVVFYASLFLAAASQADEGQGGDGMKPRLRPTPAQMESFKVCAEKAGLPPLPVPSSGEEHRERWKQMKAYLKQLNGDQKKQFRDCRKEVFAQKNEEGEEGSDSSK